MQLLVQFHTTLKKADLITFVDSGAMENFISQEFVDRHKLGTKLLQFPKQLHNADGTDNQGGKLTRYSDLEVSTGEQVHMLRFYVAEMGGDHMVLGYPWFIAANPKPNWSQGTLDAVIVVRTAGAASEKPQREVEVRGLTGIQVRN